VPSSSHSPGTRARRAFWMTAMGWVASTSTFWLRKTKHDGYRAARGSHATPSTAAAATSLSGHFGFSV
jgi:hypothetical protein